MVKPTMQTIYLHTIDKQLAVYVPGEQIYFLSDGKTLTWAPSLAQIRLEQQRSADWRRRRGLKKSAGIYGYLRVRRPADASP